MGQIVSLTTDLGVSDYYVATLKGMLYSHIRGVTIADISHHIEPYDIVQAALFLRSTYLSYPRGTIHIAAVRCHHGPSSDIIVFERDGYHFIGPNNGLFSLLWDDFNTSSITVVDITKVRQPSLPSILSHAAACIAHGLPGEEIGPPVTDIEQRMTIQPVVTAQQIRATIIHIDQFDNAIVNITKEAFEQLRNGRRYKIYFKHDDPIYHIHQHYGEVEVGEPVAIWNEAGYLEIAVHMGKASTLYNLKKNETIQIYFLDD